MITVSLIEDESAFRSHLSRYFAASGQCTVLDACGSAEEAGVCLSANPPDVALVDIQLPGQSGIEFVATHAQCLPQTTFLMLTLMENEDAVFAALKAGAVGYLLKQEEPSAIIEAILDASRGGSPMSWKIARMVVQAFASPRGQAAEVATLSAREREVLDQLGRGLAYKQIAGELNLSEHTIRTHIRGIYKKLHVNCRTEAINKLWGRPGRAA